MGCSTSAQTQVVDGSRPAPKSPDAKGPLAGDDNNLPVTNENKIVPDQTKLGAKNEVELDSNETKLSDNLVKEEADALTPGITDCTFSTCQRVDPEGTEPQPVALEEKFNSSGPLPAGLLEAGEPQPVKLVEDTTTVLQFPTETDPLQPETVQDSEPEPPLSAEGNTPESAEGSTPEPAAEENLSIVTGIVREFLVGEDEQPVEGETGEKTETEMHHEIVSEDAETKEEETREDTPAIEIESTNTEE